MGTKTIAFINNKGGCGKTTTCGNIGFFLAMKGKKVLVIDGDMQMNLSLSFIQQDLLTSLLEDGKSIYHALKNNNGFSKYISKTPYENLDIVISSTDMCYMEKELQVKNDSRNILKACINGVKSKYDYILIDSPSTLGDWVINILNASDNVIIPAEASPWGLFGLSNLFEFMARNRNLFPKTSILGVVLTKVDERKGYVRQAIDSLKELEDVYLFKNYIRIDSTVEWAQENCLPVHVYKKSSRSAGEYENLTGEVIEKCL